MKGFHRSPSQCLRLGRGYKNGEGAHVITTETQTLEQALRIIESRQIHAKAKATRAANKDHPTLRQEVGRAKFFSAGHDISLANGDVHKGLCAKRHEKHKKDNPKIPHPYRDLPEETKPAKAREMLASGSWGFDSTGGRRLAVLFGVSLEVMSDWLGFRILQSREFNDQFKKVK